MAGFAHRSQLVSDLPKTRVPALGHGAPIRVVRALRLGGCRFISALVRGHVGGALRADLIEQRRELLIRCRQLRLLVRCCPLEIRIIASLGLPQLVGVPRTMNWSLIVTGTPNNAPRSRPGT